MNIDTSNIEGIMRKLRRKDPVMFMALQKKIIQIAKLDSVSILHLKNLRHDLSNLKRVQIGSFVLTFMVKGDIVIFEDFVHHDGAY